MRVLRPGCRMASARLSVPPGLIPLLNLAMLLPFSFIPGVCGETVAVQQSPGYVSVAAGENVTLSCTVTGIVIGLVRWYKESGASRTLIYSDDKKEKVPSPRISRVSPDSDTDFTITINNIRTEDIGTYYCITFRKSTSGKDEENKSGGGTNLSVNERIEAQTNETEKNKEDTKKTEVIQYSVIAACLALLLLLVLAIVIFMRSKKKRDKDTANRRSMRSSRTAQALDTKDLTYADLEIQQRPPNQHATVAQNDHCEYASVQTGAQPQKDNLTYADLDTVRLNQGPRKAGARPAEDSSEYAEVQTRKQ